MFRFQKGLRRFYSTNVPTALSQPRALKYTQHTVDSTHVTTLQNGIQVVSRDHLGGVSKVSVRVNVGTRDETFENSGVSHYVQRFFFGPTTNRTFVNLASTLQKVGADVTSQHGREEIVYTSTHLRDATPTVLEVMSDSILYSRLHEWDIGSKRRLVEDDIEQFSLYPDLVLDQLLHSTAFAHRELGSSVCCPVHNLNKITIEQVRDFMDDNFTGENMRVVGTNVEHDALVKLVENLFDRVPVSSNRSGSRNRLSSTYVGGNAKVFENNFVEGEPNARAAVAWRGFSRSSSNYYTALVLKYILGISSRVRVGKNTTSGAEGILADSLMSASDSSLSSVESFNYGYSDDGLFGVKFTGFDGNTISNAIETTVKSLQIFSQKDVPEYIITVAKRLAALELSKVSSSIEHEHEFIMQFPTEDEVQDAKRVFSVSQGDIKRVCSELLSSKPTVVSYGLVGDVLTVV